MSKYRIAQYYPDGPYIVERFSFDWGFWDWEEISRFDSLYNAQKYADQIKKYPVIRYV